MTEQEAQTQRQRLSRYESSLAQRTYLEGVKRELYAVPSGSDIIELIVRYPDNAANQRIRLNSPRIEAAVVLDFLKRQVCDQITELSNEIAEV